MSHIAIRSAFRASDGLLTTIFSAFMAKAKAIQGHLAAREAYRQLSRLDDRLLKDIGLSRCDVMGLGAGLRFPGRGR